MPSSSHAFAVCQPGSERWLKSEIAHRRPDLHPGFQRPGVVTFRATEEAFRPDEHPETIFGRAWGCSAGPCEDDDAIFAVAERVGARHLLVGPLDQGLPDEVPPARQAAADAHASERASRLSPRFASGDPAPGDIVLDVITSPDEPDLVGWHAHDPSRAPGPCGRWVYPEIEAPFRAWRKVVEGLLWSGARIQPGDQVLEIGAAPGGGTLAFVRAGARVLAVDPKPLDPAVLALPGVTFYQTTSGALRREDLPHDLAWIACDANIPPSHALRAVERLVPGCRASLSGLFLTLKLNDAAAVATLPRTIHRVRGLGFSSVRATQLPANRRDVFVYARGRTG